MKFIERIGERHKSKHEDTWATIKGTIIVDGLRLYQVEFDSGFTLTTSYDAIRHGRIKDGYHTSVCGVGYLGNIKRKGFEKEYNVWVNMIKRCYETGTTAYEAYGAKGVSVCGLWHSFENFVNDIPLIDGFDKDEFYGGKLQLDKDIKQEDEYEKVYSLETCKFVSKQENSKYRSYKTTFNFIAISPSGERYIENNLSEFSRKHNLHQSAISNVLNGKLSHTGGWKFERMEEDGVVCE
ncbi:hypothetical protein BSK59_15900 [Paenibacillus odorifer]|uniref:hypothetical protein n=1 Tax=Paenibacillus odorifer TaxID=189426 RepID=UPI00096D5718|nr:hypothetical protein [Paenibacillus odorifer]OME54064.1 hypothetical protein BSK59_15900 [Paenibacillus odorifer]